MANHLAGLGEAPDKAVPVPAQVVKQNPEFFLFPLQPLEIGGILLLSGEFPQDGKGVVELEGHKGGLPVGPQPQAVVPVGVESGGHPVGAQVLQGEVQRPLQVLVDATLVPVGKGDYLVQKDGIPRLGDVFVHRGEQPQGVVRPIGGVAGLPDIGRVLRGVLVAGAVGELHQRQAAPVVHLGGEHEAQLLRRPLRLQVDDPLDVLHRVPVTVAVAQAAVDEGGRSGPGEGNKAVVGVPGVDHGVKFRTGGLHPEAGQLPVPVPDQLVQLLPAFLMRITIFFQQDGALLVGLLPQQEGNYPGLPRLQGHHGGQRPAAVAVVVELAPQVAPLHTDGIAVAPVGAEKLRSVAAEGGYLCSNQAEEPLDHRFFIHIALLGIQIAVNLLADAAAVEKSPGNKLGILQVDLVLLIVAVVGKLGVAG